MRILPVLAALVSPALLAASCTTDTAGTTAAGAVPAANPGDGWAMTEMGAFNEPWAARFLPGTPLLFVTEKSGTAALVDTTSGKRIAVSGLPRVDYGGQGGLGDVAFLPAESAGSAGNRTIYLSWVEAGTGDTRGAVVGKGTLACGSALTACAVRDLSVIWRQAPKVTGRGHFSHRLAISPDGRHLFVASGDRQKMTPAQDTGNTLGSIVRLTLDGAPAAGNPFAGQSGKAADIWSYGHRNILGLQFDAQGTLWDLEHGPAGGDELNRVAAGANYGWPLVSDGDHYDGRPIPRHATSTAYARPAISWNPVIAPGDFLFYSGKAWPQWRGQAIIAAMNPSAVVRVAFDGPNAREVARVPMDNRIREIVEGPDGALWLLEDGEDGRLLKLTPAA